MEMDQLAMVTGDVDWDMTCRSLDFSDSDAELLVSDSEAIWMYSEQQSQQDSQATQESIVDDILDLEVFDFADDLLPLDADDAPLDSAEMVVESEDLESEDEDVDDEVQELPGAEAIEKIEDMVLDFLTQIVDALPAIDPDDPGSAQKKLKAAKKIEVRLADRRKTPKDGILPTKSLRFPLNSKGPSIKPFAQLFRVADLAHEALVNDIPMTKRDVFYKDIPLFKSQSVVDRLVDDLAATIELGRADLNIRASSKGLVCGTGFSVHLITGEVLTTTESEGTLIPVAEDIARFDLKEDIKWVLVVEKEAVFQTLCRLRFVRDPSLPGPGIMITGKGYPDIATRQLVKTLSDNLPLTIPIMALVDGDAFGLDIASTYKYGSIALRHENCRLAAERVECIGVWASELPALGIDRDGLLPISAADEKKARTMLRRSPEQMPLRWKRELMSMLHTRRKAETEILSSMKDGQPGEKRSHPLAQYLTDKISRRIAMLDIHA